MRIIAFMKTSKSFGKSIVRRIQASPSGIGSSGTPSGNRHRNQANVLRRYSGAVAHRTSALNQTTGRPITYCWPRRKIRLAVRQAMAPPTPDCNFRHSPKCRLSLGKAISGLGRLPMICPCRVPIEEFSMVDIRGGIDLIKEVRLASGLPPTNNRDPFKIYFPSACRSLPFLPTSLS